MAKSRKSDSVGGKIDNSVKFEEVVAQIHNRNFAPVYILTGEEPFFIDRLAKMFEEGVLEPEERDFNQVVLYGKDTEVDTVVANVRQFPFGSPHRVVILKEAKELKHIEDLDPLLENPVPQTVFVICHKYGKMKLKKGKVSPQCVIFESLSIKDNNLPAWIQNLALQSFKFKMEPYTATVLSEHIGNDLSRIYTEFQKLKVFLPENSEITPDIIEKYIGISKEYNIFELQEALGNKDLQKVYKIMLNFTEHPKENPNIKTITMLYSFYNKMLLYHLSPDKSNDNMRKVFGGSDYFLSKKIAVANAHSVPQLIKIISILKDYDLKAKGVDNDIDDAELLKEMIYKITH